MFHVICRETGGAMKSRRLIKKTFGYLKRHEQAESDAMLIQVGRAVRNWSTAKTPCALRVAITVFNGAAISVASSLGDPFVVLSTVSGGTASSSELNRSPGSLDTTITRGCKLGSTLRTARASSFAASAP